MSASVIEDRPEKQFADQLVKENKQSTTDYSIDSVQDNYVNKSDHDENSVLLVKSSVRLPALEFSEKVESRSYLQLGVKQLEPISAMVAMAKYHLSDESSPLLSAEHPSVIISQPSRIHTVSHTSFVSSSPIASHNNIPYNGDQQESRSDHTSSPTQYSMLQSIDDHPQNSHNQPFSTALTSSEASLVNQWPYDLSLDLRHQNNKAMESDGRGGGEGDNDSKVVDDNKLHNHYDDHHAGDILSASSAALLFNRAINSHTGEIHHHQQSHHHHHDIESHHHHHQQQQRPIVITQTVNNNSHHIHHHHHNHQPPNNHHSSGFHTYDIADQHTDNSDHHAHQYVNLSSGQQENIHHSHHHHQSLGNSSDNSFGSSTDVAGMRGNLQYSSSSAAAVGYSTNGDSDGGTHLPEGNGSVIIETLVSSHNHHNLRVDDNNNSLQNNNGPTAIDEMIADTLKDEDRYLIEDHKPQLTAVNHSNNNSPDHSQPHNQYLNLGTAHATITENLNMLKYSDQQPPLQHQYRAIVANCNVHQRQPSEGGDSRTSPTTVSQDEFDSGGDLQNLTQLTSVVVQNNSRNNSASYSSPVTIQQGNNYDITTLGIPSIR